MRRGWFLLISFALFPATRVAAAEPNLGANNGLFWNNGFSNIGLNLNYALGHGLTAYGNLRNALLAEVFTDEGTGTMIVA